MTGRQREKIAEFLNARVLWISVGCIFFLLFSSCSNTRHISEGDELYTGARLEIDRESKKQVEPGAMTSMQDALIPRPNKKFLGIRIKLTVFNLVKEPNKKTGFIYFLKYKIGEPPVLLSQVDEDRTSLLLKNRLNIYGHFRSTVKPEVIRRKRKATVNYLIHAAPAYVIDSVFYPDVTDRLTKKISLTEDSSLLKPGEHYNLKVIDAERNRIDHMLKIEGYFYFNPDFIIVKVDTTIGNHHCKMFVELKKNIPAAALKYYYIGNIFVFPEYSLDQTSTEVRNADSILIDSMHYVTKLHLFRPEIILQSVYFQKGLIYDSRDYELTIGRLMGLGVFKFGNIRFEPDSSHHDWLTTKIFLTPFPKHSLRAEISGVTKDNGFTGPGAKLSFRNRNLFRGAELLVWNFNANYEAQLSPNSPMLSSTQFGFTPQLIFPRFITPFNTHRTNSLFVPKTKAEANYTFEYRQNYYTLNSFYFNFGYNWKETITKEHSFTPISVNFVNTTNTTALFDSTLGLYPLLKQSFERQFVLAINYSFTFTDQVYAWRKNPFYFKGIVEFSGNAAYGIQSLIQQQKGTPENPFELFNNPYSQYAWLLLDLHHYLRIAKTSTIATRLLTGIGFPYGNSDILPYYKSFYAGGVNDLRGFRIRSVGPGTFYDRVTDSLSFYNQVGDIKLEGNIEYRFPIVTYIKGALFLDAGNVWMHNAKAFGESSVFRFNTFYNQLAVDAGFGLRLDITYVVIRLDLGTPLRKPFVTENGGWKFDPLGKDEFGRSLLIFNLGIGYPF